MFWKRSRLSQNEEKNTFFDQYGSQFYLVCIFSVLLSPLQDNRREEFYK